jgi:flagellar hook-associated protein 2
MALNSITSAMTPMRISGLGTSGLDTSSIVSQLMKVERIPLDKLNQDLQLAQWKQTAYRDMTTLLTGFKSSFFDILNPTSNMLSQSSYIKFLPTSTDSSIVTLSGNADSIAGSHKITVNELASGAVSQSSASVTKGVVAAVQADFTAAAGKSFVLNIDGTAKTINIDGSITDAQSLQNAIDSAFGSGKVRIDDVDPDPTKVMLSFSPVSGSGVNKITLSSGSTDALGSLGFGTGAILSNRLSSTDSLETVASKMKNTFTFSSDNVSITINGESLVFNKSTSLGSMLSQINSDTKANVNIQYDEVADTFKVTAKQMGTGNTLDIQESGSTLLTAAKLNGTTGTGPVSLVDYTNKKIGIVIDGVEKDITLNKDYSTLTYADLASDLSSGISSAFSGKSVNVGIDGTGLLTIGPTADGSTVSVSEPSSGIADSALANLKLTANYTPGKDADVMLDGTELKRSNNTFTVNGITYNVLAKSSTEQTVSLTSDTDGVYNNIKNFVDKYNELIGKMNDKLVEKYDRNYAPLTDDQKAAMSADDITKWEDKAKTGLLSNDPLLQNVVYNMRKALQDSVKDISSTLSSIGITTGSYVEKGKLYIDDAKLKAAIQNNPNTVMNLFAKKSSSVTTNIDITSADRVIRYGEEGLAYRLSDILDDNVRTIRDNNGNKGILLEKAGMVGDSSEYKNLFYNQINTDNTKIFDLNERLTEKENNYYVKFSNLEAAITKMKSQGSWMSSMLGGTTTGG